MENAQIIETYDYPITGLHLISSLNYKESIGFFTPYYYLYYDNLTANRNDTLDYILLLISSLFVIICCGLFLFHFSVILFTRIYLYGSWKSKKSPDISQVGVTILKPLNQIDEHIYANLEGFFLLEYKKYEIIFCVEEQDDNLLKILDSLIKKYPKIDAKFLVDAENIGVNPKINNIYRGFQIAKHDLILISDAGIYMHYTTLSDMVSTMMSEDHVGLVHQVPYLLPYRIASETKRIYSKLLDKSIGNNENKSITATKQATPATQPVCDYRLKLEENLISPPFAWTLQMIYFGCWHAKIYLGSAMTGINCTTGMSCLMRKSVIETAPDGLKYFGNYLAEDFFISKHFYDSGWKVRISRQPAWQNTSIATVGAFHNRLMRWYQLRLKMVLVVTLVEPMSQCIPNGIIHAICFSYLFPKFIDPVVFFFCHFLIWFLLDFILLHSVHPAFEPVCLSKTQFFFAWLFHEMTAIYLSVRAFLTTNVNWRGKIYRIHWGGLSVRLRHLEAQNIPPPKEPEVQKDETKIEPTPSTEKDPVDLENNASEDCLKN